MCARFTLRTPAQQWVQLLLQNWGDHPPIISPPKTSPRYNIAPTQSIWAVAARAGQDDSTTLKTFRWGLLPPWAKDKSFATRTINARSESADHKPAFRDAFARKHCIIPADGYFEWVAMKDGKQPYLFERGDQSVFFFAGLWQHHAGFASTPDVSPEPIDSCTILTTASNTDASSIHDRMPVLLNASEAVQWLREDDIEKSKSMLQPAVSGFVKPHAVSRRVNSVKHDDPACLDQPPTQNELF